MAELTTLHFSDTKDNLEKYRTITHFVQENKDSIDAVIFTGNFIDATDSTENSTGKRLVESVNKLINKDPRSKKLVEVLQPLKDFMRAHGLTEAPHEGNKPELLEQIVPLFNQYYQSVCSITDEIFSDPKELSATIATVIRESYRTIGKEFKEIPVHVLAVNGNHDLNVSSSFFGCNTRFIDTEKEVNLTGKTGTIFKVKGDLNTAEIPSFYCGKGSRVNFLPGLTRELRKYLVDYNSGLSLEYIKQVMDSAEIKENEGLTQAWEARMNDVVSYQASQRERMGYADADIYITHKLPSNEIAYPESWKPSTGNIAVEYSQSAKAVYGGHFPGQVGKRNLASILAQASSSQEKTTIDGQEVAVIYLDDDEAWHMNPGQDHFFVTEYNAAKEVEQVIVYQFN